MSQSTPFRDNVDEAEVAKFNALAARWWDPEGDFRPLHEINPLRLDWIRRGTRMAGRRVVDVGCGGGILTESMADELRDDNINVNCVLPGTLDTPANRRHSPDADYGRWVSPSSIAGVVRFLSSDLAQDVHGAAVPVYGRS